MKARPYSISLALCLVALLAPLAASAQLAADAPTSSWEIFRFERLNRAYVNEAADIAPIETAGVVIHLDSPQNELILTANTVRLQRLAGNQFSAFLEVAFEGTGDLIARIVHVGGETPLKDRVVAPLQTIQLSGRVKIDRRETGYLITTVELPETVQVEIYTGMTDSLVSFCRPLSLFTGMNCEALERSLGRANLPLPGPGTEVFLPDADLTDAERERLDRYLGV